MGLHNLILTFSLFIWIPMQVSSEVTEYQNCKSKEFDSLVSIKSKSTPICTGAILRQLHIVTAAHCVEDPDLYKSIEVMAGDTRLGAMASNSRQTSIVKKIVIHPKYDPATVTNDIAILILKRALIFSDYVDEAVLAEKSPEVGASAFVSGWSKGADWHPFCIASKVTILEKDKCRMEITAEKEAGKMRTPDEMQLCAGNLAIETGQYLGDPGGPLYVNYTSDHLQLAGLLSYAESENSTMAVYTDVSHYKKWITEETGKITTDQNPDKEISKPGSRRKNGADHWKKLNKITNFMLPILTLGIKAAVP